MERKIVTELIKWKNSKNRKPLVLKGVRQCGKTYILKDFGEKYYKSVAYFNFEENEALSSVFESNFDTGRILFELGLLFGSKLTENDTLIIFDEIQNCPRAITSLKYFCETASGYHIACAGSLLGIAIHENMSFPVGKVDMLNLYPMSFYEYLDALGENMLAEFFSGFQKGQSVPQAIADKAENLLRQYYVTGGMPEVVKAWVENRDFNEVERIQSNILSGYERDFVKHAPITDFPKLTAVWNSVPGQLSKTNSKFIFSQVKKGWRAKDLEDALMWLINAGLVYKVCRIEKPFFPISAYKDETSFKLYMCDVGLLRKLSGVPVGVVLDSSPLYTEFKGAMTENYVLTELVQGVYANPCYWTSGNAAEVDFIVQSDVHIVPIEVKSDKNVKARSLAEYRKKYNPAVSVKTSMKPETNGIEVLNIPLYLIASMNGIVAGVQDNN